MPRRSALLFTTAALLLGAACHTAPPPEVPKLQWKLLRGLDVRTGRAPDAVKKLEGSVVKIGGYIVTRHEDTGYQMKQFLLVPYPNASSDYPPPPQNEIVLVNMEKDAVNYTQDPIWVEGRLSLAPTKTPWGPVTYQLAATAIQPYKE